MDKHRLIYLIKSCQQGKCSATEKAELYELMKDPSIEKKILSLWHQLYEDKTFNVSAEESNRLYDRILSRPEVDAVIQDTSEGFIKKLIRPRWRKIAAIAAVLAVFLSAYLVVFRTSSKHEVMLSEVADARTEVMPGSNKARIVFEDGSYQELGDNHDFANVGEGSFFTVDEKNGGVSYLESSNMGRRTAEVHTLITPKGGEYAIQLADGTKVWVNANSTLKYPVSFNGASVREVELEGEAYFDVAKSKANDKHIPFVVKSKGQAVEVLGTEFNINTFRDKVTTTLIEGSVKVSFDGVPTGQSNVLATNDQSIYDRQSKKVNIAQIDPYYVTAWKSGDFAFDNAPLENVMEDIARWYDVSIDYKSEVSDIRFSGKVSRFENIETLLQTIEWTGSVKLKLNGRRITVMK